MHRVSAYFFGLLSVGVFLALLLRSITFLAPFALWIELSILVAWLGVEFLWLKRAGKKQFQIRFLSQPAVLVQLAMAFALGGVICLSTVKWLTYNIPISVATPTDWINLGLVGPLIEEFIFRLLIAYSIWRLTKNQVLTVLVSSAIFALAHFQAAFIVPQIFVPFIYIQTIYVFILGIWFAYSYLQEKSIVMPLGLHVFFNLGFGVGLSLI